MQASEDPPFTHTGVDYAGPLYTYQNSSDNIKASKVYICLFTSVSARAARVKLVFDMSE